MPAPPRARPKWWIRAAVALALVVVFVIGLVIYRSAGSTDETPPAAAPTAPPVEVRSGSILYASPAGEKGPCTMTSPCTLSQALEAAPQQATIELLAGDYGNLKVRPTKATRTGPGVTVTAAAGADVELDGLDLYASNLTWRGLTVKGVVYLRGSATNSVIDQFTVNAGGAFVRADDAVIKNSNFQYGTSLDGIQIGGAHRVRIESNVVHDYNQNGTSGYHSDCIQLFDSSDIVITRNRLSNCSNAGIIFSGGAGLGITGVTVESNFVQSCITKGDACRGGSAMDVREPSTRSAIIRNNTILNGSVRVGTQPDLIFDRNIIGYLADCTGVVTNSIIDKYNDGLCKDPEKLTSSGNRVGQVAFVDMPAGDLRPVHQADAQIEPAGDFQPAAITIDGDPMAANVAGAAN
jgi:Right handed beta helix region